MTSPGHAGRGGRTGRAHPPLLGQLARLDAELLELAVQVGALEAGFFGHARHAAAFAAQVMFEVHALEGVARFAQRQVEGQRVALACALADAADAAAPMRSAGAGWAANIGALAGCWLADRRRRRSGAAPAPARAHFLGARQALLHGLQQLLQCDRFFEEIQGADAGRFDGGVDGGVAATS